MHLVGNFSSGFNSMVWRVDDVRKSLKLWSKTNDLEGEARMCCGQVINGGWISGTKSFEVVETCNIPVPSFRLRFEILG
ncbi:hypothetical protein LINPERPRIM_LOCUS31228 [Linum perenne]